MTTTTQPVELSSGGQYSGHADFINTWDQAVLATLVTKCLNAYRHCGARQLAVRLDAASLRVGERAVRAPAATVAVGLIVPASQRIGHHRAERELRAADARLERACELAVPSQRGERTLLGGDEDAQRA